MPRKYTYDETVTAFWNKVAITADDNQCWEWLAGVDTWGYGRIRVNRRMESAHRFAWSYPNYVIPDGMKICHSCDNPKCCNPKHLFLGTNKDNMEDRNAKGRQAKGEMMVMNKLVANQILEIRKRYIDGDVTIANLARDYGVAWQTISDVITRKTWKHIS